ncbi:TPA: hypothetical protein EYP83_02060 [Candidatus Geothermarchaeota archaeon]|nr:hypothetical protein [Candidatus Geothermarchaeota archaeon]HIQ13552.1 hypothetical protein [Thermoprotei archaeon]
MNLKRIFKIILYLASLTVIYMISLDLTPPTYPYYLISPVVVGLFAGLMSTRNMDLVVLSILPIPIYYIAFLLSITEVYTLNKVLSTGLILYIPIIYHLILAFSISALIYNVRILLRS